MQAWLTYLALGSSSTAGAGASDPTTRAYVPRIHEALRGDAPALTLVNRGRGGARVGDYLAVLPELVDLRAELVTILPLTDYVRSPGDAFSAGYAELIDALMNAGAVVFFGDLRIDPALRCGVGEGPGGCYGDEDDALLRDKNERLAALAANRPQLHIVPIFDQNVAHPEYVAADGHPNDLGHAYLAETFLAVIREWAQAAGGQR